MLEETNYTLSLLLLKMRWQHSLHIDIRLPPRAKEHTWSPVMTVTEGRAVCLFCRGHSGGSTHGAGGVFPATLGARPSIVLLGTMATTQQAREEEEEAWQVADFPGPHTVRRGTALSGPPCARLDGVTVPPHQTQITQKHVQRST